jgi:hypothetical protein
MRSGTKITVGRTIFGNSLWATGPETLGYSQVPPAGPILRSSTPSAEILGLFSSVPSPEALSCFRLSPAEGAKTDRQIRRSIAQNPNRL